MSNPPPRLHPQVIAVLDAFPMFEYLGCDDPKIGSIIARIGYRHPAVWGRSKPAFYSNREFGADVEINLKSSVVRGVLIVDMVYRMAYEHYTGVPDPHDRPPFDTLESAAAWLMLHGGIAS